MARAHSVFSDLLKQFSDEDKARAYLESRRWPNGPVCPRCGGVEPYKITPRPGSPTREGLWKCKACRQPFTVTVGTVFERSHIPLSKWLIALHMMAASKKGFSAYQIHRMLGLSYKSAWFMMHRLRKAMEQEPLKSRMAGIVEVDETYVGGKMRNPHVGARRENAAAASPNAGRSTKTKTPVLSLVQRGGVVRSQRMDRVTGANIREALKQHVDASATRLMTDSFGAYLTMKKHGYQHEMVNHNIDEYVRGDVHTNTVENYFSILKRGIIGTYHHVGKQHLNRYLAEFDARYNSRGLTDVERAGMIVRGAEGRRLTYKPLTSSGARVI